ncbi:MAG: DEAD/DEAH box helicase [Pseudomonadota bacterium]
MTDGFQPATAAWFAEHFREPTPVQKAGWQAIRAGRNALLVAPTGSGKTLAAFLAAIDRLGQLPDDAPPGVRVLYVSPLKALVYDVERNLRSPLVGIGRVAERVGEHFRSATMAVRTGDTPQRERTEQAKNPPEILVTTPESLYLILGSKAAANLASVETVIVDEIHALAPTKRGAHLALSLERLAANCDRDPQRIGLSATVRPLDSIAAFLGGDRPVDIVDCSAPPNIDLTVSVPVPDMNAPTAVAPAPAAQGSILGQLYAREVGAPQQERGIWPAMYPVLLAAIREHTATIIFVNSRGLCERLAQKLNELAEETLVQAHHGSISHEQRSEIEEGLKRGRIRGIVATSSLELGIDMGAVDLVLLVESPGSVARGLQRVGRAGHGVGEVSRGRLYPKFRGDLLESAVVADRMLAADIESVAVPLNPLDVLSQQLVALVCERSHDVDEIERLVRRAFNYRELGRGLLEGVLDMLSGRYPSGDFADLKPLVSWDRSDDKISPRRGAAMVMRMNAGTIPDRGAFAVHLGEDGPRVGELDEEMVFETRPGDNIMLGASTWRVESIGRDRVAVSPAPGEPGRLPFWRGDGPGRPIELGRAIGGFVRRLSRMSEEKARAWLAAETTLDGNAARNLAGYLAEQKEHASVPTDRRIVVERFRDELGDWRICLLTPFGARIHAPWAMALQHRLSEQAGFEMQVMYTDDGIVLRFADAEELPDLDALLPDPEELEDRVTEQLASTSMFAGLFRENAVRSLLLRRRTPRSRSPLWAQRLKAQSLLATVQKYPSFPIVMETYRQALADVFDLPGLKRLLGEIRSRQIEVDDIETRTASPFARSLVFAYVAAYLYEQDAPLAERKAQALTLDRALLGELLGQAELRELLDADVIDELERDLQFLSDDRQVRDADDLHDLLRRLGDLAFDELTQRADGDVAEWLKSLRRQRRAVEVRINGDTRWIAGEDAGLYRDTFGVAIAPGVPDAFQASVAEPLREFLKRYARHHGPFLTRDLTARYGLPAAAVDVALGALAAAGTLVRGEIRPGGIELDWCDAEVLRRLKRRNLARLRDEVAAVDAPTLALFLPRWHGLPAATGGQARLEEVVGQLQAYPLPWSLLAGVILPQRVQGFRPEMLDMLAATGVVVWVGRGASGPRDGRVALYLRRQIGELLEPVTDYEPPSPLHEAVLELLGSRGASFLFELEQRLSERLSDVTARELESALWDLVWAGQITNDTFAPLRELAGRGPRRRRRAAPAGAGRWALVASLAVDNVEPTRRAVASTQLLLERYGIVSRNASQAEVLSGGFGPIYKVLREMEEQGRVRRGHFVDGLTGAQFAMPGGIDRLRAERSTAEERDQSLGNSDVVALPVLDPANPYGALVPWPSVVAAGDAKPRRINGAWIVLARGRPVLWIGPRGRALLSFPDTLAAYDDALAMAIDALRTLPRAGKSLRTIEKIDGVAAAESTLAAVFLEHGFVRDYRGLSDTRLASEVSRSSARA